MEPKNTVCIGIPALLLALLSLPSVSGAQGIPHNISPILGPSGQPRPGATISFCVHPANAAPCSNFAQAYNDIGLSQLINQATTPIRTDGLGNVPAFYAAPGIYDFTVSGTGIELRRKITGSDETVLKAYVRKYVDEAIKECDAARFNSIRDTVDGRPTAASDESGTTSVAIEIVMVGGQ